MHNRTAGITGFKTGGQLVPQVGVLLYQAVVRGLKMEIIGNVVVPGIQLAAHGVGRVEVKGTLKVIVPEYENKADHFQQQKQKEVEIPP
jgi:hypothetical protein